jgi:multidrug efflux system membrane fusion protein
MRFCSTTFPSVAFAFGLCAALVGCSKAPPEAKAPPPPDVEVSLPRERAVTDYEELTGRTDAEYSINVRARVTGYLDKAFLDKSAIKEGSEVKKGDLLFLIDQRPYKAALDQAKAAVGVQEANLKLARITLSRSLDASRRGYGVISPLEIDQNRSQADQAKANLELAKANLATAQINYDFTEVRAPISGRISRRLIDANNVVVADNTLLTTIVSIDPIYVYFPVDERTLLRLRSEAEPAYPATNGEPTSAPVEMGLANEEGYSHQGVVNFEDNSVDPGTGTILMRGVFANPRTARGTRLLSPGLFARIRLPIGQPKKAILVADRALGTDQGKKYLYVVTSKSNGDKAGVHHIVERRYVQIGGLHGGLREIKHSVDGKALPANQTVAANEKVVVSGLQRIRPGSEVSPKVVEMPATGPGTKPTVRQATVARRKD